MDELRKAERLLILLYVRVIVDGADDVIGHIVDISTTGIRLLTGNPLVPDKDYLLNVDLEQIEGFGQDISFTSRCLWCWEDKDSGASISGMCLQNIGERKQNILGRLIESLSK